MQAQLLLEMHFFVCIMMIMDKMAKINIHDKDFDVIHMHFSPEIGSELGVDQDAYLDALDGGRGVAVLKYGRFYYVYAYGAILAERFAHKNLAYFNAGISFERMKQ
jgi:hypothetical protein